MQTMDDNDYKQILFSFFSIMIIDRKDELHIPLINHFIRIDPHFIRIDPHYITYYIQNKE